MDDRLSRAEFAIDSPHLTVAFAEAYGMFEQEAAILCENHLVASSRYERRVRMAEMLPDVAIPVPRVPTPAPPPSCVVQWQDDAALSPEDYLGLGTNWQTGRFSVEQLRHDCVAMPDAARATLTAALATPQRRILCAGLRCRRRLESGSVCSSCMLGVLCRTCCDKTVCRVCLRGAMVTELPDVWMVMRSKQVVAIRDTVVTDEPENSDWVMTCVQSVAVQALNRLLQPK